MKKLFGFALVCALAAACGQRSGRRASSETTGPLKGQNASDLKEAVAKIDDLTITVGEFQDRLNQQSPYIRARYTSLERKKEFLDNMVRFEVLAKEAQSKGYDKDPEVIRTMKQVMIQKLMKDEFDNRVKLEDIRDDECLKFYKEHNDEYNKPEEVRVSDISVKDAKKAREVAKEVNAKAKNGIVDNAQFRDLVTKYTEDQAAKERGGDLRYFAETSTEYPKELIKAAFALKDVGNFTAEPVKAGDGHHIMMLTGRRKALVRTFEEVKRQIQNRLYRDKRQQEMENFVAELKKKANVQVNEANMQKVMIDTSAPGPTFGGMPVVPPAPGPASPATPKVAAPASPAQPVPHP
ncbi:MAG TPA: peptidyl-prolyl cis-trans isomerase [Polyangia bacterium]|nr:peptidyl-prolyl cis-trans isomerase [Polyangia bacterium]